MGWAVGTKIAEVVSLGLLNPDPKRTKNTIKKHEIVYPEGTHSLLWGWKAYLREHKYSGPIIIGHFVWLLLQVSWNLVCVNIWIRCKHLNRLPIPPKYVSINYCRCSFLYSHSFFVKICFIRREMRHKYKAYYLLTLQCPKFNLICRNALINDKLKNRGNLQY